MTTKNNNQPKSEAKDAISEKIASTGNDQQKDQPKAEQETPPMPDLANSPVKVIQQSKVLGESLGMTAERLDVLARHASDALCRYDDRQKKGKSLLLSDACLPCESYNEVAYMCYMIGSFLEQSPMMAELAAMALLGGTPGRSKGGIIIGL